MEVVVRGSPPLDHFDFNYGSAYLSAPSSPKRFGDYNYLSAPTSPSRIYGEFDYFSASPCDWEHPKAGDGEDGFAFFVGGVGDFSRSAEELFDGGKIKPLKEGMESAKSPLLSPKHPKRSPIAQGKKLIAEALSPKKMFGRESEETRGRERDRTPADSGRRVTRSHSPYRTSHHTWSWSEEPQKQQPQSNKEDSNNASLSSSSSSSSSKSSRKWRLRDLLLFRSASEGRGTSKDPFGKYPVLYKKPEEGSLPRSRRKDPVSAHELHYARKKAETQDLKKRTFLPYKQGILGRLAGFGSLTR